MLEDGNFRRNIFAEDVNPLRLSLFFIFQNMYQIGTEG